MFLFYNYVLKNKFKALIKSLKECLLEELNHFIALALLCLSFGILAYFSLPLEVDLRYTILFLTIAFWLLLIKQLRCYYYLYFLAFVLGFSAACFHTHYIDIKFINHPIYGEKLQATVEQIDKFEGKNRVILKDVQSLKYNLNYTGKVRVSYKENNLNPGDRIEAKVNLFPPAEKILPSSFDFKLHFYFKKICALGQIVEKAEVISEGVDKFNYLTTIRHSIEQTLYEVLSAESASIFAALITGNSQGISADLKNKIRDLSISHVFAISGMHMSIIILICYIFCAYVAGSIPYILERYSIPKVGALCAILLGFIYLLISGCIVSAQRAYVMSLIMLLGIISENLIHSLRSMNIAAIFILMCDPTALFSPSMQMSFAACYGLISIFHWCRNFSIFHCKKSILLRFLLYFVTLSIATVVSSISTLPSVVYHFQNLPLAGILANLFIVPYTEFIMMPLCILLLIAKVLHLAEFIGYIAECAAHAMVFFIQFLHETVPLKNIPTHKIHPGSFLLLCLSLYIISNLTTKLRFLSIALVCIAISIELQPKKIDVLIYSRRDKAVYWNGAQYLYYGKFSKIERQMLKNYLNAELVKSSDAKGELQSILKSRDLGYKYAQILRYRANGVYILKDRDKKFYFYSYRKKRLWH